MSIGKVMIGRDHPVAIQSMTNTKTSDTAATGAQIAALAAAGCDIVRVAVPDIESARAIAKIKESTALPVVADIHFDYRLALEACFAGADKIRINPGNIGGEARVHAVADACSAHNIPIRIGINGGSLEKEAMERMGHDRAAAMLYSAERHIALLNKYDFDNICVSLKASSVSLTIEANRLFSEKYDYPLHIGVTETGAPRMGLIKSAAGIGALLAMGIGDTIRVSLTDDPVAEIAAGRDILRACGRSEHGVNIISCPTCARCRIGLIPIVSALDKALSGVQKRITVAVMGCAVNGPGEAKEADIGVAGGDGEALLFKKGEIIGKIPADDIVRVLAEEVKKMDKE